MVFKEVASASQIAFNILLFAIVWYIAYINRQRGTYNRAVIFLCILFCLFSFYGGDYFSYKADFELLKINPYHVPSFESIYVNIINFVPYYLVFRFIVWGGAIVLLCISCRLLNLKLNLILYLFIVFLLLSFSYARVSLAMCILLLGYCIAIKNKKNYFYLAVGIILMIVSMVFHRSMIFPMMIGFLSLLPSKRAVIYIIIILFPFIIYIINKYFFAIIFGMGLLNEEQMLKADHYLGKEDNMERGIGAIINFILQYSSVYYGWFIITKRYLNRKSASIHNHITEKLNLFSILFVIFSTGLAFIPNAFVLFYRMMTLSKFPMLLTLGQNYSGITKSQLNKFVLFSLAFDIYQLSYSMYLRFI